MNQALAVHVVCFGLGSMLLAVIFLFASIFREEKSTFVRVLLILCAGGLTIPALGISILWRMA